MLKSLKYRFDAIAQENSEDLAKLSQQEKKLVELKTRLAGESAKLAEISRLNERINDDQKAIPRQEFEARGLNFGALSGVQLGGQDKVVILLDASASMIHWSLVEIIRTQASGPNAIRAAFKWRQRRRSVHWLIPLLIQDRDLSSSLTPRLS